MLRLLKTQQTAQFTTIKSRSTILKIKRAIQKMIYIACE